MNSEELINRPVGWSQSGFYLIQIEEGIRAAGTVEIAGLHKKPNEKRIRMIEKQARKILPQLGKVKKEWMGFRSTLPDSLPVIGPSQKNKRIFYAFGHQHIGWTLGAVTGKIIDSLVKEASGTVDQTAREDLYKAAQKILSEEGGVIVAGFLATVAAVKSGCTGYTAEANVVNFYVAAFKCEGK